MQKNRRIVFNLLIAFILGWGVFVRFWGVWDRPFWGDEAWVAEAVSNLSWTELLHKNDVPLPPLFGVIVKAFGQLPGPPELTLRLFSVICGIVTLPLLYCVVRLLRLPCIAAVAVLAWAASSPYLVLWSRELKQYGIEAFLATLLALLVFHLRRQAMGRAFILHAATIVLICLLGPWMGYGIAFPACALGLLLLFFRPPSGRRIGVILTGLFALIALVVSCVLLLKVAAADQAADKSLTQAADKSLNVYYGNWFIKIGEWRSWGRACFYGLGVTTFIFIPFTKIIGYAVSSALVGILSWLLIVYGLLTWPRRGRTDIVCWLVGSWGLIFLAALAHKYPFGVMRMMVFCAPPTLVAAAYGFLRLIRKLAYAVWLPSASGVIAALLVGFAAITYMIKIPLYNAYWVNYDFPAVLHALEQQRQPGEKVLVTLHAVPCVRYYRHGKNENFFYVPVHGTIAEPGTNYCRFIADVMPRGDKRWWIITTSINSEFTREYLFNLAQKTGYHLQLAMESSGDYPEAGQAQLYLFSR
jgi:hypothetical protein